MFPLISAKYLIISAYIEGYPETKGIEKKVSFHCSRHSFAFQALQADIDPMTIKGALAHGSLLTTETYLKDFDNSEVDTTIQKMFDKS